MKLYTMNNSEVLTIYCFYAPIYHRFMRPFTGADASERLRC
ncbi:MAG: hypothetical protein ABI901_08680 [Roseiflexaceae bacterium]